MPPPEDPGDAVADPDHDKKGEEPQPPSLRGTLRADLAVISRELGGLRRPAASRTGATRTRGGGDSALSAVSYDVRAAARELRALTGALLALVLARDPAPPARPRGRLRLLSRHSRPLLWVAALAIALVATPLVGQDFQVPFLLAPVVAALLALPVGLISAGPLLAWRLAALIGVLAPVFPLIPRFHGAMPWPMTQAAVAAMVCYAVALRHERRVVLTVWAATVAVVAWGFLVRSSAGGLAAPVFVTAALVGSVMLVGYLVAARRQVEDSLDVEERRREESESQRAVLEERARIARELHDVVAHHMSMISVQAETAPYRIPGLGEDAKEGFTDIARMARGGLQEMRRLLGVLRDEQHGPDRAPQPGLPQLDDLIAGASRAGVPVETVVRGQARPLPAGLELSAYRIVQEALSNAAWHAPNAAVVVELVYEEDRLRLRISNEPPPAGVAASRESPGHGLIGMRERASLHGGSVEAGPTDDGGYLVDAALPYPEDGGHR